jgi:hypothetical protein
MYANPFQISLECLIGVSGILGHRLEERNTVRAAQDPEIVLDVQKGSAIELRSRRQQQELFCVAPLDILVTEQDGRKQFHVIEMNGTGIGGLTNIYEPAVGCVLEGLMEMGQNLRVETPLVLVASSGLESEQMPRRNKLIYEKVLYAEALKRGFEGRGQSAVVSTLTQMRDAPWEIDNDRPTILVGYMKEFLRFLRPETDGQLRLFGRPVDAAVNDRFCLNLVHEYGDMLDLGHLQTMNRCFLPGADKAVCYRLLNEFLEAHPTSLTRPVAYALAHTRDELIQTVLGWVNQGRKAVIKPQGTGLGHGIEFFLTRHESQDRIASRIDGSLQLTERFYGLQGGALPYTVCEFLDTLVISRPGHPMRGRKFELRVVVYRDGNVLKAFPSIAKVSSEVYNADQPSHLSLINNITASAVAKQSAGVEHMLPLCRQDTLELLGLTREDLGDVSLLSTRFTRYVLDQVLDSPAKLGLPESAAEVPVEMPK